MARKKQPPAKPAGCKVCNGAPWIEVPGGMRRCDCPSGIWYQQRERER